MKLLWLPLIVLCTACAGGEPAASRDQRASASTGTAVIARPGLRTFVIVPAESRASYHANEEFFAGAMKLIGIKAGRMAVVGATQAVEGTFQIDTSGAVPVLGENTFTVRLDTLTSNQKKRDDYLREVRDDGPSFDAYPLATFKASAINVQPSRGDQAEYALAGALTIRDITKAVSFDVKGQVVGDTLIGEGRTRILLSTFGIGPIEFADILSVADPVELEVHLTARAQP
jgi:polyisoprenoid-binding protein YceI